MSPELADVGKAHQREVRESYEDEGVPPVPHLDVGRAKVREISYRVAKQIILKYEWLGYMSPTQKHYGIFFGVFCAGATCFGTGITAGSHFHKQFGLDRDEVWVLARGACVHWAPPNTNSKLIAWSLRLLERQTDARIVAAFSDPDAGEIGTVYQATNWTYIGRGSPTPEVEAPNGRRYNAKVVGQWAERNGVSHARQWAALKEAGWRRVEGTPKRKYVYVLDEDDERLRRRIEAMAKPYPKRADSAAEA